MAASSGENAGRVGAYRGDLLHLLFRPESGTAQRRVSTVTGLYWRTDKSAAEV